MIGEIIAELRRARGMTQESLAGEIGVSSQAISKWENGTNMPDVMLLPIIADVFGVTVDELYGRKKCAESYSQYSAPELAFSGMLDVLGKIWDNDGERESGSFVREINREFEKDGRVQTLICSETGGAVLMSGDVGVVIKDVSRAVFENDEAAEFLLCLSRPAVRKLLLYNLENMDSACTAASAAKRCGIPLGESTEALSLLEKYGIVKKSVLDDGEEQITLFTPHDFLIYVKLAAIMLLAEKAVGGSWYHGCIGSKSWIK